MSVGDRWLAERGGAVRERRDPSAATTQLRWHGKDQPQIPDWGADQAIRYGYLANVVAFRCITLIANTVAARKFRAGLTPPERPGHTADHNPDARLARLLGPPPGGPNPQTSARQFIAWSIAQKLATGRYAWEIETTGRAGAGEVVALWPLASASLKAVPSTSGPRYWSRFEYGRADDIRELSVDQVLYGWEPSLADWRQPTSPLQVARYALSIALANDQHMYGFLKNSAVPAYVVGVEAFSSDDEFEAFKRTFNQDHRGPDNAGSVRFVELSPDGDGPLSESLFIQTVGVSAKDGRLPETYRAMLEQVAISIGVPWSKLDASGRTFDNASEEDRTFWESTLLKVTADFEDDVNMQLAPRLGGEVGWFDLSDVRALQPIPPASAGEIPALVAAGVVAPEEARPWLGLSGPAPVDTVPDPSTAKVGAPSLLLAKLMTINEARLDLGLEPLADGDRFLTDEEIVAAKALGGGAQAVRAVLERIEARACAAQAARERREAEERAAAAAAAAAAVEGRATVDQEARRGAIWRSTDAVIVAEERRWERAFRRLFARQERSVIDRLEGNARSKRWAQLADRRAVGEARAASDGLFDQAFWTLESTALAEDLFGSLADGAFARLSASFGISFDLEAEFAQLFIRSRANQLAGQVTSTTYQAITAAMAEGVGLGESIPDLAGRIRAVFADASDRRAVTIARTEVISGHNAAAVAAASSLPGDVVAAQQWIANRDGRTRDTHAEADGQVVPVGQPFRVGGVAGAYPGDPALPAGETVNCRCTVAFLTPDELAAEAELYAAGLAQVPVPVGRARVALALVEPGVFDEARFRRALVAA